MLESCTIRRFKDQTALMSERKPGNRVDCMLESYSETNTQDASGPFLNFTRCHWKADTCHQI